MTRVLFDVGQEYYWPSMEPIYRVMAEDPSHELHVRVGYNHKRYLGVFLVRQRGRLERMMRAQGYTISRSCEGYDVVIAGDVLSRPERFGNALLCNVDHGPGFKTLRYRNFQKHGSVRYLVFVEGRYRIERFERYGLDEKHTLVDVGLPKHDPLHRGVYRREDMVAKYGLDPAKKIVVYAPSYKPTSIFMIGEHLPVLLDHYNVLVKLHPYSWSGKYAPHAQHRLFEKLAAAHPGLHLAPPDEHNMLPYLAAADTLISEGSSVVNEFLALGRCGVMVDLDDDQLKHSDGQPLLEERTSEWLKDSFVHMSRAEELRDAVEEALNPGAERLANLERDRAYVYTHTDGHASERAREAIEKELERRRSSGT